MTDARYVFILLNIIMIVWNEYDTTTAMWLSDILTRIGNSLLRKHSECFPPFIGMSGAERATSRSFRLIPAIIIEIAKQQWRAIVLSKWVMKIVEWPAYLTSSAAFVAYVIAVDKMIAPHPECRSFQTEHIGKRLSQRRTLLALLYIQYQSIIERNVYWRKSRATSLSKWQTDSSKHALYCHADGR